jgi:hypothetical protein
LKVDQGVLHAKFAALLGVKYGGEEHKWEVPAPLDAPPPVPAQGKTHLWRLEWNRKATDAYNCAFIDTAIKLILGNEAALLADEVSTCALSLE